MTKDEIIEAVRKSISKKNYSEQATEILLNSTARVMERVQQDFNAQVSEETYPIVDKFAEKVGSKLSSMSQAWVDSAENSDSVFPEGTRYIFKDGNITNVVIEQHPQCRHINFLDHTYLLAMPYCQFVFTFVGKDLYQEISMSMTKSPIADLDGMVYNPILPNVNNSKICNGGSSGIKFSPGNMTEQINSFISQFWQSKFTGDLIDMFQYFTTSNFPGCAGQHACLKKWQETSLKDPLFILKKDIKFQKGRNIRAFLKLDQGTGSKTALINDLKAEIINAIGSIGGELQAAIGDVNLVAQNVIKPHQETMNEVLKEIIIQAYAELMDFMKVQIETERKNMLVEMEEASKRLKKEFEEHIKKVSR